MDRYAAEGEPGHPLGVALGEAEGDGGAVREAEEVHPGDAEVVGDLEHGPPQDVGAGAGREGVGGAHAGQVGGDHVGGRAEVVVHLGPAVHALEGAAEDERRFGDGGLPPEAYGRTR